MVRGDAGREGARKRIENTDSSPVVPGRRNESLSRPLRSSFYRLVSLCPPSANRVFATQVESR